MAYDRCKSYQSTSSRSRGKGRGSGYVPNKRGLNSKIHLAVDANGMPVRILVTEGTRADCKEAVHSKYETGEYELPLRHFITLAEHYGISADYLIGRCAYEEKKPLEMIYVTRDCSCEKLVQDILSLSGHERQSVVEYVELQKLREKQKK